MTALSLSFVFITSMLVVWMAATRKFLPVLLLFPLAIDSYTLLMPGLKWVDIALLAWILCVVIYVKKIGPVTLCYGALLVVEVLINCLHVVLGDFQGGIFQIVVTPAHLYLPFVVLVLILENIKVDISIVWRSYSRIILPMTIIMAILAIVASNLVGSMKQIPGVAASAGFIAVIYPIWLAFYSQCNSKLRIFFITSATVLFLLLSQVRGALIIWIILSAVALLATKKVNKKNQLIAVLSIIIIVTVFIILLYFFNSLIPENILSIIELYKGILLFQGQSLGSGELSIESGDLVRFKLWSFALEVWRNNFLIGVGSGQYELVSSGLLGDRDEVLSPHHAVLSVAADGGVLALFASLLPQLYLFSKMRRGVSGEDRTIFHFAWLHIVMSFIFGYAFNFIIIIAFYLSRHQVALKKLSVAKSADR